MKSENNCACNTFVKPQVDQLYVVTMLKAVVNSDYTVTVHSLCSHKIVGDRFNSTKLQCTVGTCVLYY